MQAHIEGIYEEYKQYCEKSGKEFDKSLKIKKVDGQSSKFPKTTAQPFYPKQYYYGYEDQYYRHIQKPQY